MHSADRAGQQNPSSTYDSSFRIPQSTVRRECTDRIPIFSERHLRKVLAEYIQHHNSHRPHRSPGQRPPDPRSEVVDLEQAPVIRRTVLGGLINECAQVALPNRIFEPDTQRRPVSV
ncbi:integrase core domain-containing protein [Streptosporangiaceae bacterium NEAU-GS5]|nr:integrase core domain-containing protein [Streptosporangiaceae bacterium NEAU-GS5]